MIIFPNTKEHQHLLGGKALALSKLAETGLNIPEWFVIADSKSSSVGSIKEEAQALDTELFAVRSSATHEDGADHSFAGLFESYLYVTEGQLVDRIHDVEKSAASTRVASYTENTEHTEPTTPSVIIQRMLTPEVSGVAFSANPVTGYLDHTVIASVWGTGSALVSGEADADSWTIDTQGNLIEEKIARKDTQHVHCKHSLEGVQSIPTPEERVLAPSLTEHQRLEVRDLAKCCADHFGSPQDIEWAYENGTLYLLQSRPITNLKHSCLSSDPTTIWDNSNIAESYSGLTSTMTFSFAERAYENVYREFCRVLSVPETKILASDAIFKNMLGHIHGHVFYNLNSWYHVLALFPGFSLNRDFMEQMMGVKEPMPDDIVNDILEQTRVSKASDTFALLGTCIGLFRNFNSLNQQIDNFYQRLHSALDLKRNEISKMNLPALSNHYQELESQLLKKWDAPLINDFFAMIFYGVLGSLCKKWLGNESIRNKFLIDAGDIISAEPPRRITEMAKQVAADDELCALLNSSDLNTQDKVNQLTQDPILKNKYLEYLEKFGDRCLEELKLESPSVSDDPTSLVSSIAGMANRIRSGAYKPTASISPPEVPLKGLKRKVFNWVLKYTRQLVCNRENLRFERTRLFGRVRKIIVAMGRHFSSKGWIDSPDDIFHLTLLESLKAAQDTENNHNLKKLVEKRKHEAKNFTTPPDRFQTKGNLNANTPLVQTVPTVPSTGTSNDLNGTGACPGVIKGRVRVIHDPRNATLQEGEILVAQQTDPGWVVLFPAASGLLVERGSLLSHSAIVARELQLPCVVSIPEVTKKLKTGDLVEMDGSTGIVRTITDEI
ncbi:PEP/pyruvate-binding domain-containing protein [Rubritalea spongiae]|uniref:PEP/pyruvate-binding domain-containing protein n=1 Tax=Rubritalea spongiae TaxID=430797 RepID=A0ABW5E7U3_9BACT